MRQFVVVALVCLLALPAWAEPEGERKTVPAAAGKPSAARKKIVASALPRRPIRTAWQLENFLKTARISGTFREASVDQVVSYLRKSTGINIVVSKARIEKDGGDVEAIEISLDVRNVSIADFLKLAFEPHRLGLAIRKNILVITSRKAARGKPVLVIYDVSSALIRIRDFPAPDINIHPSSYEPPDPPEPEIHQSVESSEELAEMLRQFVGKETWEDEGISLTPFRRHLFIRQYPEVHRDIRRFLAAIGSLR